MSELLLQGKTKGSDATTRPIAISLEDDRSRINEVYLDLVERVVVAFDASVGLGGFTDLGKETVSLTYSLLPSLLSTGRTHSI